MMLDGPPDAATGANTSPIAHPEQAQQKAVTCIDRRRWDKWRKPFCGTKGQNLRDDGIDGVVAGNPCPLRTESTELSMAGLEARATIWPWGMPTGTPHFPRQDLPHSHPLITSAIPPTPPAVFSKVTNKRERALKPNCHSSRAYAYVAYCSNSRTHGSGSGSCYQPITDPCFLTAAWRNWPRNRAFRTRRQTTTRCKIQTQTTFSFCQHNGTCHRAADRNSAGDFL